MSVFYRNPNNQKPVDDTATDDGWYEEYQRENLLPDDCRFPDDPETTVEDPVWRFIT